MQKLDLTDAVYEIITVRLSISKLQIPLILG